MFNASLNGSSTPGQRGLVLRMDNTPSNLCSSPKVIYSAGHLAGVMNYGSGRYEV